MQVPRNSYSPFANTDPPGISSADSGVASVAATSRGAGSATPSTTCTPYPYTSGISSADPGVASASGPPRGTRVATVATVGIANTDPPGISSADPGVAAHSPVTRMPTGSMR